GLIRQAGDDAVKMSERVSKQLYGNGFSFSLSLNQSQGGPPLPLAQLVLREGADMHGPFGSVVREVAGSETEVAEADVSGRSVQSIVIPDTPGIQLAWWKEGTHLQVAVGLQPAQMAIAIAKGEA